MSAFVLCPAVLSGTPANLKQPSPFKFISALTLQCFTILQCSSGSEFFCCQYGSRTQLIVKYGTVYRVLRMQIPQFVLLAKYDEIRTTWEWHIVRMWDKRNEYKILAGKSYKTTQPLKIKTSRSFEISGLFKLSTTYCNTSEEQNKHKCCGNLKSSEVHQLRYGRVWVSNLRPTRLYCAGLVHIYMLGT